MASRRSTSSSAPSPAFSRERSSRGRRRASGSRSATGSAAHFVRSYARRAGPTRSVGAVSSARRRSSGSSRSTRAGGGITGRAFTRSAPSSSGLHATAPGEPAAHECAQICPSLAIIYRRRHRLGAHCPLRGARRWRSSSTRVNLVEIERLPPDAADDAHPDQHDDPRQGGRDPGEWGKSARSRRAQLERGHTSADHGRVSVTVSAALPIRLKVGALPVCCQTWAWTGDRKSTRLNSSHGYISYAVFCLKKKKT